MMKTPNGFDIRYCFLAYVPPYYEMEQPFKLNTAIIRNHNRTTDYLFKIFDGAMNEAKIEILFNSDGKQNNVVRESLLSMVQRDGINHKTAYAKKLAAKLYEHTDDRNGIGLFSVIEGQKANTSRVVLLRFKGEDGLINKSKSFQVDYISEVFTKKSNHYKLAVYEDIVSDKSFWKGYSVDKQVSGNSYKSLSFFWVESFLCSKCALTAAQGTLQFSKVIKTILSKTPDLAEQEEIISGVMNLGHKKNMQMSVSDFCRTYLSEEVATKVQAETNADFFNSVFVIDGEVYKKELGKTVLSLQNGITAYVPTFNYNDYVTETENRDGTKSIKIEGKLRGKKIHVKQKEKELTADASRSKKNKK